MTLRLISYRENAGAPVRVGALVDDRPYDVIAAIEAAGTAAPECECFCSVADLLACEDCLASARVALEEVDESAALEGIEILAPIPSPPKLFCLATNFMSHMQESISRHLQGGQQQRELDTPRVFRMRRCA